MDAMPNETLFIRNTAACDGERMKACDNEKERDTHAQLHDSTFTINVVQGDSEGYDNDLSIFSYAGVHTITTVSVPSKSAVKIP